MLKGVFYLANAKLVCILSDIKSAVIRSFFVCMYLSGNRYFGDGAADWREILHNGRAVPRFCVSCL